MGRSSLVCFAGCVSFVALVFSFGCKGESKEPECVEPPQQQGESISKKVTQTRINVKEPDPEKLDKDWCRTCVMGPRGWASCQVVFAETDGESRENIQQRARQKACLDSGFAEGTCPENAVVAMSCKGDKTTDTRGNPAKALQQVFFGKQKGKKAGSKEVAEQKPPGK